MLDVIDLLFDVLFQVHSYGMVLNVIIDGKPFIANMAVTAKNCFLIDFVTDCIGNINLYYPA
jgi:hypothetical protein